MRHCFCRTALHRRRRRAYTGSRGPTTTRWARALRAGGTLESRKATGRPCRLSGEQLRGLYSLWETRARWTTASFAEAIRLAVGVKYDPDHVGRLIVRLGLRPARVGRVGQMELAESELRSDAQGGALCHSEARAS